MTSLIDFVALSFLPIGWWKAVADGLRGGTSPIELLDQLTAARPHARLRRTATALRERATHAIERAQRGGIAAVPWSDAGYPSHLAAIVDPPPVVWAAGGLEPLHGPAVAIVGSRAGSPYAIAVAETLGADLAGRGIVVVSGLARGVDAAAHRGALRAGHPTFGILGSGVDVLYPREHHELSRQMIAAGGGLLSELAPGTPPQAQFFPRRNRIISGLVRAVVVIEAGEKSGSLITARCALEQGREVLAVPGNILNGRNRGGHALIRDGAKIVETADDIVEELNLGRMNPAASMVASKGASGGADPVLASLTAGDPSSLDEIAARTGQHPARLLPRLFELEMAGLVVRAGGGRFVRIDRSC
jgi:DNA processing protein